MIWDTEGSFYELHLNLNIHHQEFLYHCTHCLSRCTCDTLISFKPLKSGFALLTPSRAIGHLFHWIFILELKFVIDFFKNNYLLSYCWSWKMNCLFSNKYAQIVNWIVYCKNLFLARQRYILSYPAYTASNFCFNKPFSCPDLLKNFNFL